MNFIFTVLGVWTGLFISTFIFNCVPFMGKYWVQNNTEQSLEWILEAKNDNT